MKTELAHDGRGSMTEENPWVKTYCGVAHTWLCDEMGHMNTRNYVGMFDDAMQHFMQVIGHNASTAREKNIGWADVRHEIDYMKEVPVGALVHINCAIVRLGGKSITYNQEMILTDSNETAAINRATSVLFDLKARKAIPLTENIRKKAEGYILK